MSVCHCDNNNTSQCYLGTSNFALIGIQFIDMEYKVLMLIIQHRCSQSACSMSPMGFSYLNKDKSAESLI